MSGLPLIAPNKGNSMPYNELLEFLLRDGSVETNSPKNRIRLYEYLRMNKIDFYTEIIGYSKDSTTHNGLKYWNKSKLGMVAKLIAQKRILYGDLQDYGGIEKTELLPAFRDGLLPWEIYQILNGFSERLDWKYNIFTCSPVTKTVKRITIKKKIP